jgi:hypothetical protein
MDKLDRLMVIGMIIGVLIMSCSYTYIVAKRVSHVESITFGGARCPKA